MPKTKRDPAYDARARRLAGLKEELDRAKQAAFKQWKERNKDIADEVGYLSSTRCYYNRPVSFSKVFPLIMERLMWKGWAHKTQKEILDHVAERFPDQEILPNVWRIELDMWALKKAKEIIQGNAQKPINIKGCRTLADIKKRLRSVSYAMDGIRIYKPKIGISDDALIIDKNPYEIEKSRKHPSIRVMVDGKRVWLRMDALEILLNGDA